MMAFRGITTSPTFFEIHPTLACNLRCGYCSIRILEGYKTVGDAALGLGIPVNRISIDREAEHLTITDFLAKNHVTLERSLKAIEEALFLGIRRFRISGGGEPLFKPERTFAIMEAMSATGGSVELVTNGVLLEGHIDKLLEMGLDILSVSMDVALPYILDARRGRKGTFTLIAKALGRIASLKKAMHLTRPRLHLYSVLDEESIRYVPSLMPFAQENNIEKINFILRKDGDMFLSGELDRISESVQEPPVVTNVREIQAVACREGKGLGESPCPYPFNNIVVHANGLVTPCCSMKWGVGEFIQDKSIEEVWRGNVFADTRAAFHEGKYPEWCYHCREHKL
jgi:MoaA/NifB/PqqE/SkfB family radical SAM enzyme